MRFIEKLKRFASKFFDKGVELQPQRAPESKPRKPLRRIPAMEFHESVDLFPASYLVCHQPSELERAKKIKAQAEERRQRRNAKRLAAQPRTVIFTPRSGVVL